MAFGRTFLQHDVRPVRALADDAADARKPGDVRKRVVVQIVSKVCGQLVQYIG
jgi:hypothetical protein